MTIEFTNREVELIRDTMQTARNDGNVYTNRIRQSLIAKLSDALRDDD
jgi:hypothetical protein